jgi:hypothetical protein
MAAQSLLTGVLLATCCLQTVDRFNNLFVTAYVTPGNARFLLLHEGKNDEAIRTFFTEVHELFLRVSLQQDIRARCRCPYPPTSLAATAGRTS